MKKIYLSLIGIVFAINSSYAQWTTGTDIYNTNSGNVGIGTTSPLAKLHLNGGIYTEQSTFGQTSVFFNHYYAGSSYVNFGWYGSSLGYIKQNDGSSLEFNSTNSIGFTVVM